MVALITWPTTDTPATEARWSTMASTYWQDGVVSDALNQLRVFADSTGLLVKVDTGRVMLRGFFAESTSLLSLPIATAHATLPRIDNIVARVTTGEASAKVEVIAVTGTAAASPTAPPLQNTATVEDLLLATVAVAATTPTIAAGAVTDGRTYSVSLSAVNELSQAKGDLFAGTGAAGKIGRVPAGVGVDGQGLVADSVALLGVKWQPQLASALIDGVDLSYSAGQGIVTANPTGITVTPVRAVAAGYMTQITTPSTAVTYPTRPGAGTRIDSVVLRVSNATGGLSTPAYAIKVGSAGSAPAMQTDSLFGNAAAVYEIEIARLVIGTSGTATVTDVRPISKGVDGQSGSVVKVAQSNPVGVTWVDFANAPQTFRTLWGIVSGRTSGTQGANNWIMRVNGNANATNWTDQGVEVSGTTVSPGRTPAVNFCTLGLFVNNSNTVVSVTEFKLPNYSTPNIQKPYWSNSGGYENTVGTRLTMHSGYYTGLEIITSVHVASYFQGAGDTWIAPSQITLYGMR